MITVRELMKVKGSDKSISVAPTDTVYRALQVMAEKNVGAVVVCEQDAMVGIFTERDYCRKIILMGRSSLSTQVQEIMTKNMITVKPEQQLEECLDLMARNHIRHLPVDENGYLVDIVSMRDVMEAMISIKQDRIDSLENYIMGRDYGR